MFNFIYWLNHTESGRQAIDIVYGIAIIILFTKVN